MALSLQLGYPDVPKSVTNPKVSSTDALDLENPMSLTTFLKIINVSFEPESLQNYYNHYLKLWNNLNVNKTQDENVLIVERYRDFIKDVSLNYTTPEEKEFLSKIDFNDPYDLDVAMGFYGKKLKELALYYNNKRDNVKFNITRTKIKGTNTGVKKLLSEITADYLKNLEDGKILYDYDQIKSKIELEIEELWDTYPLYFNQDPDEMVYDKKDLDYGYVIFLKGNEELINEIFAGVSDTIKEIKEVDSLFDNKRKLTKKDMATDYYYLSTGATTSDFISGQLFESDSKVLAFLNRDYPTTASTPVDTVIQSDRLKGFFKPSKTSIILVDGNGFDVKVDVTKLEPNKVYYFPDPKVLGDNDAPLIYTIDDGNLKKNYSSGWARNQPKSTQYDTKYYGYASKLEMGTQKYLDKIFNDGFIGNINSDIYGNLFGLFKNENGFNKTNFDIVESEDLINLVVYGYRFVDDLYGEWNNFDFYVEDLSTFRETHRSGLSTNTGGFFDYNQDITFRFGYFTPYNELIEPTESNIVTNLLINECAFVVNSYGTPLQETYSSDLSAFELSAGEYYYSYLYEGGIASSDPLVRALVEPTSTTLSSLTADASLEYPYLSTIGLLDGGVMGGPYPEDIDLNEITNVLLSADPAYYTSYSFDPQPYDMNIALSGRLYVRNAATREIDTFLNSFSYINTKFNQDVINQLSANVLFIDTAYDTLFIETINYLIINKIKLEDGVFVDPKTSNISLSQATGDFDRISNRFKVGDYVYYCKINTTSDSLSNNNFSIYPEVYRFDLLAFKNELIYPINNETDDNLAFFSVSGLDTRYVNAEKPTLSYSSRNNIFNISFLLKDQNNFPRFHVFDFEINPDVNFLKHDIVNFDNYPFSNILDQNNTLAWFLSSFTPSYDGEELVV